jgi:hypothetical protein
VVRPIHHPGMGRREEPSLAKGVICNLHYTIG